MKNISEYYTVLFKSLKGNIPRALHRFVISSDILLLHCIFDRTFVPLSTKIHTKSVVGSNISRYILQNEISVLAGHYLFLFPLCWRFPVILIKLNNKYTVFNTLIISILISTTTKHSQKHGFAVRARYSKSCYATNIFTSLLISCQFESKLLNDNIL